MSSRQLLGHANTRARHSIAGRGHHIANHTWSHPDLRGIPDATVRDELLRTSDLLGNATGRTPTWFRAPGGDWSDASHVVRADEQSGSLGVLEPKLYLKTPDRQPIPPKR
ncbi:polysaccharide deacetylase family protein [Kitasatospora sp. NPDC085879]|uniref:polysaccharide deacetylase family protein n=1 Tax=Kitasatospora sp. NPDC085879 TaxID=3154769 RepID=UPI00343D7673